MHCKNILIATTLNHFALVVYAIFSCLVILVYFFDKLTPPFNCLYSATCPLTNCPLLVHSAHHCSLPQTFGEAHQISRHQHLVQ